MKKLNLSLDKTKKYVVACSFGPDSMALLDSAIKCGLNLVVAHVNYRKREAAQAEQEGLQSFCDKHNIKLYVLDLLGQKSTGNFQDWARQKRYEFFKSVVEKEGAYAVLVAHQEDDVIETYLMQKKRGNFVKNYGISEENELYGVKIIRPLLGYSKQDLRDYDNENNIPYSIDESNLTDHYTRNKIRHSIVEKLSDEERAKILEEIKHSSSNDVAIKTKFNKQEFLDLRYEQLVMIFDYYMVKAKEHRDLSEKFVNEIKKGFENKTNLRFEITKRVWVELDYNNVFIVNASKIKPYQISFENKCKSDFLDIDFRGGAEDRGIDKTLTKFMIKNCCKSDKLIIKDYNSQIRKLFIDWKMPLFLREIWPGIYDEEGRLIYVPRYRENFKDEHKSKFKIDTNYFLDF